MSKGHKSSNEKKTNLENINANYSKIEESGGKDEKVSNRRTKSIKKIVNRKTKSADNGQK
jgi:hypothetical protein